MDIKTPLRYQGMGGLMDAWHGTVLFMDMLTNITTMTHSDGQRMAIQFLNSVYKSSAFPIEETYISSIPI